MQKLLISALLVISHASDNIVSESIGAMFPSLSREQSKELAYIVSNKCLAWTPSPVVSDLLNLTATCSHVAPSKSELRECIDTQERVGKMYLNAAYVDPIDPNLMTTLKECVDNPDSDDKLAEAMMTIISEAVACRLDRTPQFLEIAKTIVDTTKSTNVNRLSVNLLCNFYHTYYVGTDDLVEVNARLWRIISDMWMW